MLLHLNIIQGDGDSRLILRNEQNYEIARVNPYVGTFQYPVEDMAKYICRCVNHNTKLQVALATMLELLSGKLHEHLNEIDLHELRYARRELDESYRHDVVETKVTNISREDRNA